MVGILLERIPSGHPGRAAVPDFVRKRHSRRSRGWIQSSRPAHSERSRHGYKLCSPVLGTFHQHRYRPPPSAPEQLFQYNAELAVPFAEQANTVYWLKIVALTDNPNLQWGWHDRDYTQTNNLFGAVTLVVSGRSVW